VKRHKHLVVAGLIAAGISSCAVDGGVRDAGGPALASMPAAKLGLPPPLRVFYDELEPYGDWVLVEPYGWLFRPRVNTVAWRPYRDGRWEPSYSYGWVWQADEPFGWITDHYGFWLHDEFQGWVWQPYGAWAPSWVAWVEVGDFVGWAPLPPDAAADYGHVPGGVFTYVSRQALAGGPVAARASFVRELPVADAAVRPINRIASHQGVFWNAGPDPEAVLGPAQADRIRAEERDGRIAPPAADRSPMRDPPSLRLSLLEERTVKVWSEARRELLAERTRRQDPAPGRSAAGSAGQPPDTSAARYKPSASGDSAGATPADSLGRARRGLRPGAPRPPKKPGGP
jgi:hypothetical protein